MWSVGTMPDGDAQQCDFCRKGRVITRKQQLAFRQWTDRGYVHCRAEVPIGLCNLCSSKHWNEEAEAIIEEVVRREYDKLPRVSGLVRGTQIP
jgi:hypothetical protein